VPTTFAEWSRRNAPPTGPSEVEWQRIRRRCQGTHAVAHGIPPEVCVKEEVAELARVRRQAEVDAWTKHTARIPWARRAEGEARTAQITLR
jgi:hypothetical protein